MLVGWLWRECVVGGGWVGGRGFFVGVLLRVFRGRWFFEGNFRGVMGGKG